MATKMANRWFIIFGFSKNERTTIDQDELLTLQEVAKDLFNLNNQQLLAVQLLAKLWRYAIAKRNSHILSDTHKTASGLHSAGITSKR